MEKEHLLEEDDPKVNTADMSLWLKYIKNKNKKSSPFKCTSTTVLVLVWAVLVGCATLFAYTRLTVVLLHKYSPQDSFNLAFRNCYGRERICLEQERYMAPMGAYLMIVGLVLSIFLIFSFVWLPLGGEKILLRKRLRYWLIVDLVLILVVGAILISGAVMVILHRDDPHSQSPKYEPPWQKVLWDAALISSPFFVLGFHVWFWRKVCLLYTMIDLSKEVIKDVWSAKI